MFGSPQHPLPRRVPHCKVLAVWGDPWDVGSTHGLALPTQLDRPPVAPKTTPPTSSILPVH